MLRNKKFSLMLVISMVMFILVGCSGIDEKIIDEGINILTEIVEEELANLENEENTNVEQPINETVDNTNSNGNQEGDLEVHVIDIGQGSANFIVGADGKTMLYDAGGEDSDSGRVVVDYIKSLGYDAIDVAVFTHPHSDHINGAPTILKELDVKEVYYPKVTHTTKTFEKFVDAVNGKGLKFKTAKAGIDIPFGVTEAKMLAPISDKYENLNDYSATVKLDWGETSVLLTGDVEKISENEMINSSYDLNVDLLLVPHHGSNSSTTNKFLDKTTPSHAIISAGRDNSYGHPHKEVMDRLKERNIETYVTAELGNIVATLNGNTINITTR